MSNDMKQPWATVAPVATEIWGAIRPVCVKASVAGSLRRNAAMVSDIDIVVLPKLDADLYGDPAATYSELHAVLARLVADGVLASGGGGGRLLKYGVPSIGTTLELYIANPDNWGYLYALRTGSKEFNKAWVLSKSQGGMRPGSVELKDGFVYVGGVHRAVPTEKLFFEALDLPLISARARVETGEWTRDRVIEIAAAEASRAAEVAEAAGAIGGATK